MAVAFKGAATATSIRLVIASASSSSTIVKPPARMRHGLMKKTVALPIWFTLSHVGAL